MLDTISSLWAKQIPFCRCSSTVGKSGNKRESAKPGSEEAMAVHMCGENNQEMPFLHTSLLSLRTSALVWIILSRIF